MEFWYKEKFWQNKIYFAISATLLIFTRILLNNFQTRKFILKTNNAEENFQSENSSTSKNLNFQTENLMIENSIAPLLHFKWRVQAEANISKFGSNINLNFQTEIFTILIRLTLS